VDKEGLCLAAVPQEAGTARLAYVTPSHQFPTGAVLPLARRLELLDWAERADAYIIEDDYDSEYRYEGRPVEAVYGLDRRGRTVYVGTLSKVLFPALRLGFLVLPEPLVRSFVAAKWLADRQSPSLEQAVLAELISEGHFERHLRRMRTLNGRRRQALLGALGRHLGDRVEVAGTNAGVHLLVWLRDLPADRLEDLISSAAHRGVGLYSIAPYFIEPPERVGLLMGYASLNPEEIEAGVHELAMVMESFL
jgi:GntR family transcriptional regulator/MocR family aminotransferase